jgi:hypothetical protein
MFSSGPRAFVGAEDARRLLHGVPLVARDDDRLATVARDDANLRVDHCADDSGEVFPDVASGASWGLAGGTLGVFVLFCGEGEGRLGR